MPQLESLATWLVATTLVGAAFAVAVRLALPHVLAWRGVWFCWRTKFGPALVFDSADEDGTTVRLLNVNGTYQSVCYVDDDLLWVPVCAYHRTWAREVRRRFGKPGAGANKSFPGSEPLDRARADGARADGASAGGAPTSSTADSQPVPGPTLRRALVMGVGGYSFP